MSPQRPRTSAPWGHRMCVEIVSLGKVALSTSRTLNPRRASSMAVGEPAHRAPMTMASYIVNLRVDRHYPTRKVVGIGRITQNQDLVKLGNSADAGQARQGRVGESEGRSPSDLFR